MNKSAIRMDRQIDRSTEPARIAVEEQTPKEIDYPSPTMLLLLTVLNRSRWFNAQVFQ